MPCVPYELRIGVTGHRTIADEPAIATAIRDLLNRLAQTLNCVVAPLQWTVVSPLARGADRVVADAVLERPEAALEVVTPFPVGEYRRDFETADDHAEFDDLLTRARRVDELDGTPSGDRSTAYLRVGERVVDSSELLIAVWDGQHAKGLGGTADVVQYALERERVVIWIDATSPHKRPRLVRAIRGSGVDVQIETAPLPRHAKALSRGYVQQAAYCEDKSVSAEVLAAQVCDHERALSRAATDAGLPASALDALLALVLPEYVRADALALAYHRKHGRAVNGVLYLAAFAVTIAVAQVLFFPDHRWIILFEVAAMAAVFAVWSVGRRARWHERWLHDRYLAERLRTVLFTALLGQCVPETTAHDPLPFYRGPQQWLVHLVTTVTAAASAAVPPLPFAPLKQFLIRAWLQDQQTFHARSAHKHSHRAYRRHQLGFVLFGTTLVMALLHMLGVGEMIAVEGPRIVQPASWITGLALVLPVWAGAIHATTSQLELERIAERSRRMARALESLIHRAMRVETPDALALVVRDAVSLMLMETHEWWVLLSFQDVRLHV